MSYKENKAFYGHYDNWISNATPKSILTSYRKCHMNLKLPLCVFLMTTIQKKTKTNWYLWFRYLKSNENFIGCLVNELERTKRFKFRAGENEYKMEGLYPKSIHHVILSRGEEKKEGGKAAQRPWQWT